MPAISDTALTQFATDPYSKLVEVGNTILENLDETAWHKEFTTEHQMKAAIEDGLDLGTVSQAQYFQKLGPIPTVSQTIDYQKRRRVNNVGAMIPVPEQDLDDMEAIGTRSGYITDVNKALALAFDKYLQTAANVPLLDGIQGQTIPAPLIPYSDNLTADGLSLFNDAHKYKESILTFTNIAAADLSVDPASFPIIRLAIRKIFDGTGYPMGYYPEKILAADNVIPRLQQVFGSMYDPNSASNAKNIAPISFKGGLPKIVQMPLFPDSFWFVMTDAPEKCRIEHCTFKNPTMKTNWDWRNSSFWFQTKARDSFQPARLSWHKYYSPLQKVA